MIRVMRTRVLTWTRRRTWVPAESQKWRQVPTLTTGQLIFCNGQRLSNGQWKSPSSQMILVPACELRGSGSCQAVQFVA